MVVNVLVYIESCEDVERVTEVYLPWNSRINPEDWEVCATNYGVNMNSRHYLILIAVETRLDDPHAVVRVWVVGGFAKVMDKSPIP